MVFAVLHAISQFIQNLIATNANLELCEFTQRLHDEFYSDIDISFMNDFLALSEEKNKGKFIIPHQKLIEYGIVVSGRSSAIKTRMDSLDLIESQDYLLQVNLQQLPSRAKHSNQYMLTPEAFFKALTGARDDHRQGCVIPECYRQCSSRVVGYFYVSSTLN